MEGSKNDIQLTEQEKSVYTYAFRDEFKGMGIDPAKQDYYIDKILNASDEAILHLRKNGAIAIAREVVQPNNIFDA
ncbi:MAG: hypothetical protein ACRC0Q_14075 [Kurthia gibsonii]|uniref:Uncharacterized protein n=1 Tax=Kurthia gibsonii TaxID=33946 RepID=A0ABU9LQB8_9BACL|nr:MULTISPECIES: hypothetical protein [Kurthia]MCA9725791.1 hypothetical protein [Kurthia sp.]AMA62832.1 hypothetical protein ASO14_1396 [Kurthia sp. 11kri321]MEB6112136.1 hypothetical protein [Kurthia gibsonii]MEB7771180.1 hypothetical protein [Kurthia gibsonii]RXH51054.1 hypothetical protein D6T70_13355 [Kurthia gibsonii]